MMAISVIITKLKGKTLVLSIENKTKFSKLVDKVHLKR
jgi:hypothetical protein